MKTLKQILSEHYTVFEYDNIESAVKEWLEQKRQSIIQPLNDILTIQKLIVIDELLEELKK